MVIVSLTWSLWGSVIGTGVHGDTICNPFEFHGHQKNEHGVIRLEKQKWESAEFFTEVYEDKKCYKAKNIGNWSSLINTKINTKVKYQNAGIEESNTQYFREVTSSVDMFHTHCSKRKFAPWQHVLPDMSTLRKAEHNHHWARMLYSGLRTICVTGLICICLPFYLKSKQKVAPHQTNKQNH